MLDHNTIRIGDRVRDLVASKAGREQLGTIISTRASDATVEIAWDWTTKIDCTYMSTWYLEPLERPTK